MWIEDPMYWWNPFEDWVPAGSQSQITNDPEEVGLFESGPIFKSELGGNLFTRNEPVKEIGFNK